MTLPAGQLPKPAWRALKGATASLSSNVPAAMLDDPTGLYAGAAAGVVRPQSTAEVQALIRVARAHGLTFVPRGGGTGLAAGAVPRGGEIVLDLSGIRSPLHVDPLEMTVTAGAGLTLAEVQKELAPHGLWLPLDLGSRESATVGGMIATNAGGTKVLRHGHVRQLLLGVEAVLGSGEIIRRLEGWRKDNNGPDFSALLCGSEGTLAVVTAASFRVAPLLAGPRVVGMLVPDWAQLMEVSLAARALPSVQSIEMVSAQALRLVRDLGTVRTPFRGQNGHLLLVEHAGDQAERDCAALVDSTERWVTDVVVADGRAACAALWATRHGVGEAVRRQGRPHKLDLALPVSRLASFLPAVQALVARRRPSARAVLFGHVADGNVHVNITGASPHDHELLDAVVELAVAFGGHASAEHGIGVSKARWLPLTRPPAELELLDGLRKLFDPTGVLNPRVFRG